MAQLVKLLDYISRYESNPFHYPAQYIRLKKENWRKLQDQWENELHQHVSDTVQNPDVIKEAESQSVWWNPFKKQSIKEEQEVHESNVSSLPSTKNELTHYFLNRLYPLQIKWATSTISHTSFTKQDFEHDEVLKYFLQRFPDLYLLMYYPIFNVKNAPIDAEIVMISPLGIEIISMLQAPRSSTVVATNDRVWTFEEGMMEEKVISPTIALRRTEQIIKSILQKHQLDFPIKKTVLAQHHRVRVSAVPYQINIVDQHNYEDWFTKKRALSSPLKSTQLKIMEALLKHSQTTAMRRPEWTEEQVDPKYASDFEEL